MAWRIADQIVNGEIDNRTPGHITGKIWLAGSADPVILDLTGNPMRDMAGCLLTFSNSKPQPAAGDAPRLNPSQVGTVGDMTASRKVREPSVSEEEMCRLYEQRLPIPTHRANCLYLEWFSEANGRVVIEAVGFQLSISEPTWRMSREQERQQVANNREALAGFLQRLTEPPTTPSAYEPEEDRPMDEFQWEKFLKASDARTDRYGELLEKYKNHPQQEQLIARAMGWTWLDEMLEARQRGALPAEDESTEAMEEVPPLEPDPATEGVDWVLDKHGHPQHPLVIRATDLAMDLYHRCKDRGQLGEDGDADLHDMLFQTEMTGAKLAGALNTLCYRGADADPGFLVACLKRALKYLGQALTATSRVAAKTLLLEPEVLQYRNDLLAIRQEILDLMRRYRARPGW
jgi:hypothetical protein